MFRCCARRLRSFKASADSAAWLDTTRMCIAVACLRHTFAYDHRSTSIESFNFFDQLDVGRGETSAKNIQRVPKKNAGNPRLNLSFSRRIRTKSRALYSVRFNPYPRPSTYLSFDGFSRFPVGRHWFLSEFSFRSVVRTSSASSVGGQHQYTRTTPWAPLVVARFFQSLNESRSVRSLGLITTDRSSESLARTNSPTSFEANVVSMKINPSRSSVNRVVVHLIWKRCSEHLLTFHIQGTSFFVPSSSCSSSFPCS